MDEGITIVCLGDSLTAGSPGFSGYGTWSGNPKSQYEYWLERKIEEHFPNAEIDVLNFGVGGNTIWQMIYRYKRDVLRLIEQPTFVIIMGGINDILGVGTHEGGVKADLSELYDIIVDSGATPIPMEIAPASVSRRYIERIKKANEGIHEMAKLMEVPVVPTFTLLRDEDDWIKPEYDIGDGVHFTVAGYKAIGEKVFETILPLLKERCS